MLKIQYVYYINYIISDKTNTILTHTITKIFIELALKIINEIKQNNYFTLKKSFIEDCHSLHAFSTVATHKLY